MSKRRKSEAAGRRAEILAAWYLRLKGYRILAHRFKTKAGEIDLIASKKNLLVFVEVKARSDLHLARDSLTWHGQKRITAASDIFYARRPEFHNHGIRYDAIFITRGFKVTHQKEAWRDERADF